MKSSQISKLKDKIINSLENNSSYQFRYSLTRNSAGTKTENNLGLKIAALQLQSEKKVRIINKRMFASSGISGVAYTLVMDPLLRNKKVKKLIDIKEVAELILRNSSVVYKYIEKELLPKSCEQKGKKNYWCEQSVIESLVKVKEFQSKSGGNLKAHKKNKKKSINVGYKPKQTNSQKAAHNAFNLCVNN